MRGRNAERVEHAGSVVGHVGHGVGAGDRHADRVLQRIEGEVGCTEVVEALAQADVAVVEADHAIAPCHQAGHELGVPGHELHAQAHDEQQRLTLHRAVVFDFKGNAVG